MKHYVKTLPRTILVRNVLIQKRFIIDAITKLDKHNESHRCCKRKTFEENTNCQFSLILKIKKRENEFECIVDLEWNHPILALQSLSFKDIP